jgi:sugar phosphate isomerase/epimerase
VKLGFLTACLPEPSLIEIAEWAAARGFRSLEVSAWPSTDGRPHTAAHIDAVALDEPAAHELGARFAGLGLSISSLAYYENNLHADPRVRARVNDHVRACVDAAALLGVPTVGTFVGRDITRSVRDNLGEAERVLPPLVEYATARGVRLIVENCPMAGWHPDGYPANLAYSPELWEWLFGMGFWLNFDPSHLVGLGIDPVTALREYVGHVAHVQAKDVEVLPGVIDRYGFFGKTLERESPWDHGWWRFRMPGLGQVDWRRIVDVLYEGGFDGTVSIEHEDPIWRGSEEKVKAGLRIAQRTLEPLMVT